MSDLADEQIAEQLAAFMGWHRAVHQKRECWDLTPGDSKWLTLEQETTRVLDQWNPACNIAQAFLVQAKIQKHTRPCESKRRFIDVLLAMSLEDPANIDDPNSEEWTLINATARQRCLAAIAVINALPKEPSE